MTKFLPENPRKAIIYALLLVLASGGIVYFNFFLNRDAAPPASEDLVEAAGGLLPYGGKINLRILSDERFLILKAFPAISVDPALLGKPNLFERQ